MANAFMSLGKILGESTQQGFKDYIEVQSWDWEIEAETSWTKGGGASVGKPVPGKLRWEHFFDTTSTHILGFVCAGKAFPEVILKMCKTSPDARPEPYFTATMSGAFITKVSNAATEEGNIAQQVEMVFKHIKIEYRRQNEKGGLMAPAYFEWDIPAGTASPSA